MHVHLYIYIFVLDFVSVCMHMSTLISLCAAALPADRQKACRLSMLSPLVFTTYFTQKSNRASTNTTTNKPQAATP